MVSDRDARLNCSLFQRTKVWKRLHTKYIAQLVGFLHYSILSSNVADPGSGAFLTPRSGIPSPYFWELSDKFLGKKFYNSLKIGQKFFLQNFENRILYNFVKFMDTKKLTATYFFSPHSFVPVFASGIRDPGSGIRDPGSEIRDPRSGIRDPGSEIRDG